MASKMKSLFLLFACIGFAAAVRHDGAQVFEVVPRNDIQLRYLEQMESSYNFWKQSKGLGHVAHIMAEKDQIDHLQDVFLVAALEYNVIISDVQKMFDEEKLLNDAALEKSGRAMEWSAYHTYDEIMAWCDELAATYPSLVTVADVGTSYEGRTMKLVTVSTGGDGTKKSIFVDAGIHAREWIAPATATFVMNELITNSAAYQSTLDLVDFHFMPSVNPDGYAYTWAVDGDRTWRKTRSNNVGSLCVGTDGNRNWDFQWGVSGSSDDPCEPTYMGSEAFSEVEMMTENNEMSSRKDNIKLYLSYHSYGQYFLYSWGYTTDDAPTKTDLVSLAESAYSALYAIHGTNYTVESAADLYPASGASDDYAYGALNIPYSYTIELRNKFTFQLNPDQIIPTGEENWAAFQVLFEYVRDNL